MSEIVHTTEFWVTAAAAFVGAAVVAIMVILERRPRRDINPRLLPTTPFLFVGGVVAIFAFVHLLNLIGFHTGRN